VQRPHPPVLIGGGGRLTLTLAARQADIVGFAPRPMPGKQADAAADPRSLTAAATEEKLGWVRDAAGDRFDQLELNAYPSGGPAVVTNNARAVAQERADDMRRHTGVQLTAAEVLDSPHVFIGSIAELTQKFVELRDRFGISSFLLEPVDELAPVVEALAGR
jgi:alkanesulfonate monooxygenase SsuD/methylene tetrahydromethanopterin reductase-like flavin-dependent oxidoreductase (luciferase family)